MTQRTGSCAAPPPLVSEATQQSVSSPHLGSSEWTGAPPAVAPPASRAPLSAIHASSAIRASLSHPRILIRASLSHPHVLSHSPIPSHVLRTPPHPRCARLPRSPRHWLHRRGWSSPVGLGTGVGPQIGLERGVVEALKQNRTGRRGLGHQAFP